MHAWVQLEARWLLEQNYDGTMVEASLDSVTWTPLAGGATTPGVFAPQPVGLPVYQATRRLWAEERLDLSPFAGPAGGAVCLRLRTVTDSYTGFDGFSFDSLRVLLYDPAAQPAPVAVGPGEVAALALDAPRPNPARALAHLGFSLPRDGTLELGGARRAGPARARAGGRTARRRAVRAGLGPARRRRPARRARALPRAHGGSDRRAHAPRGGAAVSDAARSGARPGA